MTSAQSAPPAPSPHPLRVPGFQLANKNTAAHAISRSLLRHGVTHVFGQSIPSLLMLTCEELGIQQVAYRTENAGGYMGDGYARISNKPCVVAAQNGPAATLLVAAMGEAMKASIPMVALVQDVARDFTDKNAFQEYDHLSLYAGCTKWARVVNRASRVEDYIDMAFTIACSGRPGPVALMLPADMLLEEIPFGGRRQQLGFFPLDPVVPPRARLEEAAQKIAAARRPIVIAGGGVHLSGAAQALAALQEAASLPVATTMMGKGSVADTHPLSVGVVGLAMGEYSPTRFLRSMVTDADLVILVGNRTNQNGTDSYQLYPRNAEFIHIDIDGVEVGRNYDAFRLVGDAKETLLALTDALANSADLAFRQQQRSALEAQILAGKQRHRDEAHALLTSAQMPMRPERVMTELDRRLDESTVVVADASYSSFWTTNYLTARAPGQRFLTPRGMAGLGWGFPMAIGAKVARPDARVFCVSGDGGFGHVWSELETARRMGIAVTLIVLNNGILGFSKHADHVRFGAHSTAVNFAPVNHAQIAEAAGCRGVRVKSADQLSAALDAAQAGDTTMLIEVMCDENAYPPFSAYSGPADA